MGLHRELPKQVRVRVRRELRTPASCRGGQYVGFVPPLLRLCIIGVADDNPRVIPPSIDGLLLLTITIVGLRIGVVGTLLATRFVAGLRIVCRIGALDALECARTYVFCPTRSLAVVVVTTCIRCSTAV